ncbi:MAG: hypothetical protein N2652_09845 [Kiritimatiellae bacterium]|nr:hypothetical protein [Kiritimatiellia bacterium]
MSPASDTVRELLWLGRRMRARAATRLGAMVIGGTATALALLAAGDLWLRYGPAGRWGGFAVVAAVGAAGVAAVVRRLGAPLVPDAIAARIERACPELDNRLINRVQLARLDSPDAMIFAYLREPPPALHRIPPRRLGDPTEFRAAVGALALALAVMGAGRWWGGAAWVNAALRVLSPWADRPAATLATILEVSPGDARALVGEPLRLAVRVRGRAGVPVRLDLSPADDRRRRIEVGRVPATGEAAFEHLIPRVTADLAYRFLAGDAVTPAHRIVALPPPALMRLAVRVEPPAWRRMEPREWNALAERVIAPEGATLVVSAEANRPMAAAELVGPLATNSMEVQAGGRRWAGSMPAGGPITVAIRDSDGFRATTTVQVDIQPDPPPVIELIAPAGRVRLDAGARPRIQFRVHDDSGVARVQLEQLTAAETAAPARVVAQWNGSGAPEFEQSWTPDDAPRPEPGRPLVYRIAAWDTHPLAGDRPRSVSAPIVFDAFFVPTGTVAESLQRASAVAASLGRIVELQRGNLETSRALANASGPEASGWAKVEAVQREIFQIAESLLADPSRPLGAMAAIVRDLHAGPMREAIGLAARVPRAADAERPRLAARAVAVQSAILRALTAAEQGAERVAAHRAATGLLTMLDGLVQAQGEVLAATRGLTTAPPPRALVTRQDRLAEDTVEFVGAARREATELAKIEAEFARRVAQVADECERRQVARTMLAAAGHLESGTPSAALPLQEQALAHLREFQALLNQWRATEAQQRETALREVVESAREAMKRLAEVQGKVVEAIRQTEQQKDRADRDMEEFLEELGELKTNMAEALLKIATDLHIFPELPVGNDLVADVYQIYEEVAQVPGSESTAATELGLQKEDWILEALETATERLDDMEMWLVSQPDAVKRNTENFDQQELPQIPVIPLASEIEDIIGDLLEQEEDIMSRADDSATNQGSADMPAGWGIAEGEFANFSAKGKSGNERPDHKDQDGRSIVGRQGMSDGETVAGSGKIHEGDRNIEARRTQDSPQSGQVQEEGHAEAKATGGGKGSGYSDRLGMAGTGRREDAKTSARSELGLQAMLRRQAEALYAKASLAHVRTGSLEDAVRAMQQAEDALRRGAPIREVREFQRRAVEALARTRAELDGGLYTPVPQPAAAPPPMGADEATAADAAPPAYRDLVAEYFRSLSEGTP